MRWRFCLFLAMLLLLPVRTSAKEDDEEGETNEEEEEDESNDDDDEEEESSAEKPEPVQSPGRRAPPALLMQTSRTLAVTRTLKKRPLECYVCAFKSDTPLRACLDPTKYRVNTIICHEAEEKCFTSVVSKGSTYEAVIRGCRSSCVSSTDVICCESNKCNNQAYTLPTVIAPRELSKEGKATKTIPPPILFFVTILLVLQTVVKVTII